MNDNSCLITNLYHNILPFDDHYTHGTHQIFKRTNRSPLQLTHHSPLNLVHNDALGININRHEQILNTVSSKILQHIHKTWMSQIIGQWLENI